MKNHHVDLSGWFHRFMHRHSPNLCIKALEGIKSSRVSNTQPYYANEFAKIYEDIVVGQHFDEENVINADETKIRIDPSNSNFKAITCNSKSKNTTVVKQNKKWATFVPFHSNKKLVLAVIIIPFTKKNKVSIKLRRHDYFLRSTGTKVFYTFNKSGCMNTKLWQEILILFKAEMNFLYPNKKTVLLLDNLNSHVNVDILHWSIQNNIQMLFFPKYSSSYLQPSDDQLF